MNELPRDTETSKLVRGRPRPPKIAQSASASGTPSATAGKEPPPRVQRFWKIAGTAFSVAILLLSVVVLVRTFSKVNYWDLRAAIQATNSQQIEFACLFTAMSYLALTGYDAIALRQLKLRVRYSTTALASFTSFSIAFTLGFPLISAGTVRYWIYSQAGLTAGKVASLTVIASVTFWLGMALIIGASLVVHPVNIAALDHLSAILNFLIGLGVLAALLSYLGWVGRGHRRTRIQGLKLELPGFWLTLGQVVLGVLDICSAASVLYVLLPTGHGMDFLSFAATYSFACLLGIASNVPGGIGAFEATMLNTVPAPSQEALLASLLLFRVFYYLLPFVLALALLGAHESMRHWNSLREEMSRSTDEDEGD